LRKLILGYVLLTMLLCAGTFFWSGLIWEQNFLKLEKDDLEDKVPRALRAWEEQKDTLISAVLDWSGRDDLAEFAAGRNPEFMTKTLNLAMLKQLGVHFVAVADSQGNLVFHQSVDVEHRAVGPAPIGLVEHFKPESPLWPSDKSKLGNAGMLPLPHFPILIAVERITAPKGELVSPKRLVFGRYMDKTTVEKMSRHLNMKLSTGGEVKNVVQEMTGDEVLHVSAPLRDVYGQNSRSLIVSYPRHIWMEGKKQQEKSAWILAGYGALSIGVMLLLLKMKQSS
jgi:sensor domain CHASE-containing protein